MMKVTPQERRSRESPKPVIEELRRAATAMERAGEPGHALSLGSLVDSLKSPLLRVVVFGQFSRGKSTLINALLGRRVLPAKAQPTTGHVTHVIYGKPECVRVRLLDGTIHTCPLEDIASWAVLDMEGGAHENVDDVEVVVSCPLLKTRMVLSDTPGVQEADVQTERAIKSIARADLVLFVLHAGQLLHQEEERLIIDWMVSDLGKPVVPIVNWMQTVDSSERNELRRRMDLWSARHLQLFLGRAWYEVDAMTALRHRFKGDPEPQDDYVALARDLQALTGPARKKIQQTARLRQVGAVLRQGRRSNHEQIVLIADNQQRVLEERETEQRRLRSVQNRLGVSRKVYREHLGRAINKGFNKGLTQLQDQMMESPRADLEQNATDWFAQAFHEMLRQAERTATFALSELKPDGLRRSEPLTVVEQMILNRRIHVEQLAPEDASGMTIASSAAAGAAAASFIPVVGTIAGAVIGGVLGAIFGTKEPDYGSAYAEQASQVWDEQTRVVWDLIMEQFDARVRFFDIQINNKLAVLSQSRDLSALDIELKRRRTADKCLSQCEKLLSGRI